MSNQKKYIAFFDLDKTLININSGTGLVKMAYARGMMEKRDVAGAIFQSLLYKLKLKSTESIISSMGNWFRGFPVDKISSLSEEAVSIHLINSVYPLAKNEILYHKENGAELAILSSAIAEVCRPIASLLGIDSILCTEMESLDGVLTGRPSGNYCFGREKYLRLSSYCREHNFDPKSAFYYADSISDLEALAAVGNPVCVNPDKNLKTEALKRGWVIKYW